MYIESACAEVPSPRRLPLHPVQDADSLHFNSGRVSAGTCLGGQASCDNTAGMNRWSIAAHRTWVGASGEEAAIDVLFGNHQDGALRAALHQLQARPVISRASAASNLSRASERRRHAARPQDSRLPSWSRHQTPGADVMLCMILRRTGITAGRRQAVCCHMKAMFCRPA